VVCGRVNLPFALTGEFPSCHQFFFKTSSITIVADYGQSEKFDLFYQGSKVEEWLLVNHYPAIISNDGHNAA
jgi:hypothetical protein